MAQRNGFFFVCVNFWRTPNSIHFCGTKFGQQPCSKPNFHKLVQHSFGLTHQMNAFHHILDIVLQVPFELVKHTNIGGT